jgi:hypothetical protein
MKDNILFKKNNNYRTLYEREKEKSKYISSVRKNSVNYFHDISDTINQSQINNCLSLKVTLNKGISNKDIIGSNSQKQFGKQNLNNNFIDNSIFRFYNNMKVSASMSDIEKTNFKRNNEIKTFQYNHLKNYNPSNIIYSKGPLNPYLRLTGKNSDSRIKIIKNNNLDNNYDKYTYNNNTLENKKTNQLYNKYRINIDSSINNVNDILFTDNSSSNISNINSYSLLNSKIFNKSNKICLTQQNKDIKFMNIFENNLRKISKNVANSFNLKNN